MKVNLNMLCSKRGVSLIVVLMFMLVATIAATATWKWISSEGKSGVSRMLQNEAYQSSVAGIEHARAWMTFNANETGALLRQYLYKNDGTRKKVAERVPINIDAQVRSFDNGARQDHHVWLMEANIDTIPYVVKILSEGMSRDGKARHTEVAFFKISGLYQILTDTTHVEEHIPIDFSYAYFGGSYNGAGDLTISSAVVNGNWKGNPQSLDSNFIVTGNAILDGNSATVGPLMCIGGSASLGNQGITAQDVYIDEHISPLKGNITGNAYFGGTVKQSNTGAIVIGGSATIKGTFLSNQATNEYYTQISGNLCVGDSGLIVSNGEIGDFLVGSDVWMPGDLNLWFGNVLGSECSCFDDVCFYNDCQCNGSDCKEGSPGAVCTKVPYNESCNDGDWLSHTQKQKNPQPTSRNWYRLFKETRTVACTGPADKIIGCKNYGTYSDKTNYDIASNKHPNCKDNHSQCAKFILGNSNKSKAYIKSSQPSANYNSVLMAKVFDEPYDTDNFGNRPRSCLTGVTITDWRHNTQGVSCDKQYWHTGLKKEDDYRYRPYGEAPDSPGNKKGKDPADTLYYMYSMPEGTTDVGFGSYLDDYWYGDNTYLWSYFVDFTEKSKSTSFTNSYHTNSDDNHPAFVEAASAINSYNSTNKYYRLLNYTGTEASAETSNKMTGTPYCKLAAGKNWRPQCGVNSWFVSKGTVSTNMTLSNKPACAEDVKSACDKFWEKSDEGCDGAKYLVRDPIVTAKAKFEPYADYGCAKEIKTYNTNLVSQLNACYKRNVDNNLNDSLYNGFLVVKVSGGTTSTNPGGKLLGKFIVIAEEPLYTSFMDTEDDSYVFYYMEKGINTLNDATRKNTFIYSEGHIGYGNQFKLTGTIYVTAASCEGMDKLQGSSLTYDHNLTQVLSNACVICSNDGSVCGSKCDESGSGEDPGEDPHGDDVVTSADSILDPYFISNAPQLNVTIETQYQSSEQPPSANADEDLSSSFIVLPRIVHLCTDASGKLEDYFNVLPLNGADLKKADANVQCTPSLNVSTSLVSAGDTLAQDVYTCTANPTNYSPVPFYVWVYGSCAEDPAIRFEYPHIDLVENEDAEIKVLIPPNGVTLATTCPPKPSEAWSIVRSTQFVKESNGICTFTFPGTGSSEYKTLFTVRVSEKVTEGMSFTLQIRDGYRLEEPWTTTLGMSEVTSLCRDPATPTEIGSFCSMNPDKCPPVKYRSNWKDCPYDDNDIIWVVPDWSYGYTTGAPPNNYWKIMGANGILRLKENPGTGCIVIIPTEDNSKGPPIPEDPENSSCLRASGKAGWHNVKLQFVGDVESGKNPFVHYNTDEFAELCHYDATDHSCTYPVFDGSKVNLSIDKEDAQNKGFSYWKCTGPSCPTTDAVGSGDFGTTGFTVNDDNTIVEIHFGEQDKHCFFDEFRRGSVECNNLGIEDTAQYCIDDCIPHPANGELCKSANDDNGVFKKSKWHLLSGTLEDIATNQYPSYIMAKSSAPDTGVKVISTVQAGYHGTLRALMQVPHQKSQSGRSSNRIRHSGFMLRSNAQGDDYLMLNVYENLSGHLEAQVCSRLSCQEPQELRDSVYPDNPLSLSTSSLVMLSATLAGEDSLLLYAFLGDYYYGSSFAGPKKYKTLFKLRAIPTHASETYSYVGFKMADKDFKLYGIGWRSEDYNSECFDGPPVVTCSYAAVAVDGIVETGKLTKPWVGYSGWFDNKNCSVEYWYYHGSDVDGCPASNASNICGTDGYTFMAGPEAGQHGYIDPTTHEDIKTAKVNMSCGHDDNSVYAWSESADHTHCGPFWTGEYTECKTDIANLLSETVSINYDENLRKSIDETINLRGQTLVIELLNESEGNIDLEVALLSKNSNWNDVEVESRSITISGSTRKIVSPNINVVEAFANNTTTGFDPEHVVGFLFTNHSNVGVEVVNISAKCKNAIHCGDNCCSVEQVGESTWQVKVRSDGQNMNKVGSVDVTVDVDGSTAPSLSTTAPCPGCYTINIPDADIFKNKGKPYQFYAKLNATDPDYAASLSEPEACGSITPSGITCSPKTIADINSGDSWPLFEVTLNHCPSSNCHYNVTLGKNSLTEFTVVSDVSQASGSYQYRYEGTPVECNDDGGCAYTYLLESTESDKPFSCSQTFTVKKKNTLPDLSLDCSSLQDQTAPVNTPMTTSGSVTATGCETGCTWSITDGSTEVGHGDYGSTPYSFTGATTAGTVNYVFSVKRTEDNEVKSCDDDPFSVEYVAESSSSVAQSSSSAGGCVCIAWVNGTGDYDQYCYSSGLNNMNDKCYTMNAERGTPPTHINNNAADTYWWTEVSCTNWTGCSGGSGVSSSSAATSSSSVAVNSSSDVVATPLSLTNTANNSGGPLENGAYSITTIGSCTNVRFNCAWNSSNTGCSIKVNGNEAVSGGMNSSNNVVSPKPGVGDVLYVTGVASNIWCAQW